MVCTRCTRRTFLASLLALTQSFEAQPAGASLARGLTLEELVTKSAHHVVATALDAHSEWATFGPNRVIVTETRVRIEEALVGGSPGDELLVRVLGGRIGELGERVDGQAELVLGRACVLFLTRADEGRTFVTGAAEGHYLLAAHENDALRLEPSPHLPRLLHPEAAAVAHLRGRTLAEARELVRAIRAMRRLLVAALVAVATLSAGAGARAYCRERTCDPADPKQSCDTDVSGCVLTGAPLFWSSSCISFDVQAEGSPKKRIDADQVTETASRAFAAWLKRTVGARRRRSGWERSAPLLATSPATTRPVTTPTS